MFQARPEERVGRSAEDEVAPDKLPKAPVPPGVTEPQSNNFQLSPATKDVDVKAEVVTTNLLVAPS